MGCPRVGRGFAKARTEKGAEHHRPVAHTELEQNQRGAQH